MIFRFCAALLTAGLLLSACSPEAPAAGAPQYSGEGPAEITIPWDSPSVFHIQAGAGSLPFQVSVVDGLDSARLIESSGPVDEYRGHVFPASGPLQLSIKGDRVWKITLLPPSEEIFPVLHVPGEYKGNGNTVLLVEGKYGIAAFDFGSGQHIEAWAFGPEKTAEPLYIKPDGDYRGKTVLPKGLGWLVVSAAGPWSVRILEPCCELP